ncbi:pilus assembly protein [Arenibacterium halophilum]|nr:pilus assembly protein [Arenibacterium halophilum]
MTVPQDRIPAFDMPAATPAHAKASKRLKRFARDEEGTLLIFGVYIFVLILMVGGIGIDLMRFERDRSELQYTLDRAVLAAADLEQTLEPADVVRDYFNKAGLGSNLRAVSLSQGLGYRTVSATADAEVRTQFMHMTGLDTMTAPAKGTAEERVSSVEISLVLDVSGSMSRNNRLVNLKTSAKEFVDTLLGGMTNASSISIIPYATQVNAGEPLLSKFNVSNEHSYSHCVNFIPEQFKKTDIKVTDDLERTAHFDPFTYSEGSIDLPVCPVRAGTAILPLSGNREQLHAHIDSMTAGGNTSIDLGMKWGAAMLDPSLRGPVALLAAEGEVDPRFVGRPLDYDNGETLKIIVLISDGENTDQYFLNPSLRTGDSNVWYNAVADRYSVYHSQGNPHFWWPHRNRWEDHPYGDEETGDAVRLPYTELFNQASLRWIANYLYSYTNSASGQWLSAAYEKRESSAKNQYTKHICGATKDKGVIVYTIGLEAPKVGLRTLKDCASSDSHFFEVEGLDIADAFSAIATSIRKLRLTQ